MENKEINIQEYGYNYDQDVVIKGGLLTQLMEFVQMVKEQECREVLLIKKPEAIKKGEIEWKNTDITEFFNQSVQEGFTFLGAKALSLQYNTAEMHFDNIEKGIAKHHTELVEKGNLQKVEENDSTTV